MPSRIDLEAEVLRLRHQVSQLNATASKLTQPLTPADRDDMRAAMTRADGVYQLHNRRAPDPLPGETPIAYRARLASGLQNYSPKLARERLDVLPPAVLDHVSELIYADAITAAGVNAARTGELVAVTTVPTSGLTRTEYHGSPNAWMAPFKATGYRIKFIREVDKVRAANIAKLRALIRGTA